MFKTTPGRSHLKTTDSEPLRVGPGIHLFEAPQVISGPDRDKKGLEDQAWGGAACSEDQLGGAQGPLPTTAHNPQPTPCKRPSLTSVYMLQPISSAGTPRPLALPAAPGCMVCPLQAGPGQACSGRDPRAWPWPHCSEIMKGPLPLLCPSERRGTVEKVGKKEEGKQPTQSPFLQDLCPSTF